MFLIWLQGQSLAQIRSTKYFRHNLTKLDKINPTEILYPVGVATFWGNVLASLLLTLNKVATRPQGSECSC